MASRGIAWPKSGWVGVVVVDAFEDQRDPVQQEPALLDPQLPEPDRLPLDLQHPAVRTVQREEQRVEVRLLRRPGPGRGNGQARGPGCVRAGEVALDYLLSGGVEEDCRDPAAGRVLARHRLKLGVDLQGGVSIACIEGCPHPGIPDEDRRTGGEVDVPEDAAEPPHVLVFQVAPVAPLEDLHCEQVAPGTDSVGDIELGGHVAALAVADEPAVDPDVEGGVDPLEGQEDLLPLPARGKGELPPVAADRVLVGNVRRVHRVGVADVGVVGDAVALHLPVAGDGDPVPALTGERICLEPGRHR